MDATLRKTTLSDYVAVGGICDSLPCFFQLFIAERICKNEMKQITFVLSYVS